MPFHLCYLSKINGYDSVFTNLAGRMVRSYDRLYFALMCVLTLLSNVLKGDHHHRMRRIMFDRFPGGRWDDRRGLALVSALAESGIVDPAMRDRFTYSRIDYRNLERLMKVSAERGRLDGSLIDAIQQFQNLMLAEAESEEEHAIGRFLMDLLEETMTTLRKDKESAPLRKEKLNRQ